MRSHWKRPFARASAAVLAIVLFDSAARADQATLQASKDNTLYEYFEGLFSNGAGEYIFAGRNNQSSDTIRRALIAFDVAALPAGSTINSATLTLNMSMTSAGPMNVSIHRLTSDWGEGASNASGNEGGGANSQAGDATWEHTFYNTQFWTNEGGDYVAGASATTSVAFNGPYSWTGANVTADVQYWLDNPGSQFGWIVIGDESAMHTAKRFDSRTNPTIANRPKLVIDYTPPAPSCPADLTGPSSEPDGMVNVSDLFFLLANWNTNGPGADLAAPNDIINVSDLFVLLSEWGDCE